MRLDYRITYLLSIYKKEFGDQTLDSSASVSEIPIQSGESNFTKFLQRNFSTESDLNHNGAKEAPSESVFMYIYTVCLMLSGFYVSFHLYKEFWAGTEQP